MSDTTCETDIPEDDGDPRLMTVIQAMLKVFAPIGSHDDMPVEEMPVFRSEHWDDLPHDHVEAAYGEHITKVAMVRVAKAALATADRMRT